VSRPRLKTVSRFALVVVFGLIAAGCDVADWEQGGKHRPYYCDPTDTEINDGHTGGHGGHEPHYTEEKGPLSAQDCLTINIQFAVAVAYAAQFPTAGVAEANGFTHLAPWIPGQGTHHLNDADGISGNFDPTRPNLLMYDSNDDSGELTGMVWAVVNQHGPPEGFVGNNDHWHSHAALCFNSSGFIIGDSITDEQCAARGGTNVDTSKMWLLHVWLPEYADRQMDDVFNKTHPDVN
jgi:hypothetical protein